ncbi:MAG: MSHA pilin protein MshD [Motiliproteus sp.]|jgi:MSHA pilin protein MshD
MPVIVQTTNPAPLRQTIGRSRGFTLVELIITIMVLSIALLGMVYSLQFSVQHSGDSLWQTKTVALVQAYGDEILSKKYDHTTPLGGMPSCDSGGSATSCSVTLGPESGEQRGEDENTYNDVDDYHGLDEMPPIDALGAVRSDYAGYRIEVSVSYASGTELGLNGDQQAKLISITVTPPTTPKTPVHFSLYRGNF